METSDGEAESPISKVMAYILWGISYIPVFRNNMTPALILAPPFPLIKSLFFIPLLSHLLVLTY